MMSFCAPADPTARLAVLGVLSSEESPFRRELRRTWMKSEVENGILPRFVIRGVNASASVRREAEQHGDVVFVEAPALDRSRGPIVSLMLFLPCALQAWPNARLIGKADDDVFLHLPGIALHLQQTLVAAQNATGFSTPHVLWGSLETYHWDSVRGTQSGFAFLYGWESGPASEKTNCRRTRKGLIGPYHFAKGPLLFLSAPLTQRVQSNIQVHQLAQAAIASARPGGPIPYEDAFLGVGLAIAASAADSEGAPIVAVHAGDTDSAGLFIEANSKRVPGDVLALAPSTLVYHEIFKHTHRLGVAHKWATKHHCDATHVRLKCLDHRYVGCGGATWLRCYILPAPFEEFGCSLQVTRLSGGFVADATREEALPPSMRECMQAMAPGIWSAAFKTTRATRGVCGVTEFGMSDCDGGQQGAWVLHGSMSDCVRRCHCCSRCRYVSYSHQNADCSWFSECNLSALQSGGQAATFRTLPVKGRF